MSLSLGLADVTRSATCGDDSPTSGRPIAPR
jgi:hypothetical protein